MSSSLWVSIYLGSFGLAAVSGVLPIINAELYLIGLVLAIGGIPEALILAVLLAAGQMLGKGIVYQTARGAALLGAARAPRLADKLARTRARIERWRARPLSLTFLSASVGLPPLCLVSLVAGVLELRFRTFLFVGFLGRTLRFGTIGLLAAVA